MTSPAATVDFAPGSLVRARGRDWVVLPGSDDGVLVLRPIGGGDGDTAGVLRGIEEVSSASFAPPSASDAGSDRSARLLREALRIGFRSTGGPFRCLASLGVSPRPYQLVPLLMALKQETVRLVIADDVGIGKTVEAGLIAAELLAQGTIRHFSVLCPPSLAEQWRLELTEKFGLDATLVLPGTVTRLERDLEYGQSVFERHPYTVVSTDFIKSAHRRDEFLRAAPELIIVDEAHGAVTDDSAGAGGRTHRYRLMLDLAAQSDSNPGRHLILTTATPHSGNDTAFRNLIGLVNPALRTTDLSSDAGRRLLAEHMVQRRRADIRHFLGSDTHFPSDRQSAERAYRLSTEHRDLFDDVLAYVRGQVRDTTGSKLDQRIRWWSALSLLRAMASSPAAAAATLATRAAAAEAADEATADRIGAADVHDQIEADGTDGADAVPGAQLPEGAAAKTRTLLRQFQQRSEHLADAPASDAKLALLAQQVRKLHKDGFDPIVFCRFIPTAGYVAHYLRGALKKVRIESVTGELPAEERAARVATLLAEAGDDRKVLVATDCLSEGVNLQEGFQAVIHYDLAWNPTRHEQREGRVDRFGQVADVVRALLLYGEDNGIDGIIMDVLLRKHEAIRKDLGVAVPVPPRSDQVLSALLEGVLMRGGDQLTLDFGDAPQAEALEADWRSSAESEKRTRARFAQAAIHPEEVQRAIDATRASLGAGDITPFLRTVLTDLRIPIHTDGAGRLVAEVQQAPLGLHDALGRPNKPLVFAADYPVPPGVAVATRTDPAVTAIAHYVLTAALDPSLPVDTRPARRVGIIRSRDIHTATVALLLRLRTRLTLPGRDEPAVHIAEDARMVAFTGPPSNPQWLSGEEVERILAAVPTGNIPADQAYHAIDSVLAALPALQTALSDLAASTAEGLSDAHRAVRRAARGDRAGHLTVQGLTVEPLTPVDVLGVYLYRPDGGAA